MKVRLADKIFSGSIVDGKGLRHVIYFQGCDRACEGCHNKHTWDQDGGELASVHEIYDIIKDRGIYKGITLSGGEPFLQPLEAMIISSLAKHTGYDVWCYTGFKMEELLKDSNDLKYRLLDYIDVLVDGEFKIEDVQYVGFKGSKNQRYINVRESLVQGKVVEFMASDLGIKEL